MPEALVREYPKAKSYPYHLCTFLQPALREQVMMIINTANISKSLAFGNGNLGDHTIIYYCYQTSHDFQIFGLV